MKALHYHKIKIGFFSLALAILFFASVLHRPETFSETENRYLAERPALSTKSLLDGSFMKDYETYIVDQFPKRSFFTGVKTLVERARGKHDDNEVYFGKDGYLFGKYDTKLFESEVAKRNVASLIQFAKENKSLGREHFQVVMVPSSSEILKEKLPKFAPVYNQAGFIRSLKTEIGDDFVFDTVNVLSSHKEDYIYYRTDHHWTTLGAYYVYQSLMDKMGMEAKSLSEFQKEEIEEFFGTYDSKVNTKVSGGVIADKITLYHSDNKDLVMTLDGKESETYTDIYMREHLTKKDKYSVFMGGNHSITDIKTGVKNEKKLLVLKDSFAHSLVPFLLEDYNRVVMIDLRHFNKSLKKYMKENSFTDVLVLYSTADFVEDNNIMKLLR